MITHWRVDPALVEDKERLAACASGWSALRNLAVQARNNSALYGDKPIMARYYAEKARKFLAAFSPRRPAVSR